MGGCVRVATKEGREVLSFLSGAAKGVVPASPPGGPKSQVRTSPSIPVLSKLAQRGPEKKADQLKVTQRMEAESELLSSPGS